MFRKFVLVYFIINHATKSFVEADTKIDSSLKALADTKRICGKNEFECKNRRCVPLVALCDSVNDCGDDTDENEENCKIVRTVSCPKENQEIKCQNASGNGQYGDEKSHFFLCQWRRIPKNESNLLQCRNNVWTPSVTYCARLCRNVTFFAESVNCYRNGKQQNCTAPFLTGTQIQARCPPDHKATFEKISCDENGEWDHERVECVPICGKFTKHKLNYVQNVRPAERREFPWNVGLYGKDKSLPLCPATIISPSLVLTTSTCVQEAQNSNRNILISKEEIEIIVAKSRRDASKVDDDLQKSYRVHKIFVFEDHTQNITNNLALVELNEKINSSTAVYPICLNWNKYEKWIPANNSEGQITTWRIRYDNGTSGRTSTLAKIAALYSSPGSCLENNSQKNFTALIQDQFCVKIGKSSPYPHQTGSAWTYVEKNTNFHFLGGLLNNDYRREAKDVRHSDVSFVDLNYPAYVDWINGIRKQVDPISKEISFSLDHQSKIDCRSSFSVSSSETAEITTANSTTIISTEKPAFEKSDNCTLPDVASLNASNYVLDCRSVEEECRNIGEDTIVSLASKLSLTCKPGYVLKSNVSASCVDNRWKTFPMCIKTCPPVVSENANVECFLENSIINCDGILKAGTRVTAKCKKNHEPKNVSDSTEIRCKSDGVWSGVLRTCIKSKPPK